MAAHGESPDFENVSAEDDAQEILARILDDLDRGGAVDPEALREEFPNVSEEEIARLCSAASRYEEEALFLRMDWEAAREQEVPQLEPDTIIGDYVVEAPIGRGGMGCVYRARQRSLGDRRVALKVLPAGGKGDEAAGRAERFSREARAASSLHHPNLAEVYGFGTESGVHYYAMRLVEGPTLREVLDELAAKPELRRKRSVRRRIVRRVAEVAGALAEVHGSGLVHRDVKPSNIMLEGPSKERIADRAAVLVDFGLVRPIDTEANPMTRNAPATPAYAAPELLLGQEVDARTDVFGLGVTLYDLLTGRRPTERMQASAGLEPIGALAPEVDPDLQAIVSKATDPMAKWRYADASALQRDLNAWLDGLPVAARTQGLFETAGRWVRRHPWSAVRTAGAVVLLGIAGTGALWATDVLARSRQAREAFERGDVETLYAHVEELPEGAPGAWLVGSELSATRAQLLELEEGPLTNLGAALRREDFEEMVTAVLHGLETEERANGSLAHRALLFRLREDGASPGAVTPRMRPAIAGTMLYFEAHPDVTPEQIAASAPFRDRLVELLGVGLPTVAALEVVSALGGCGTIAEVPEILRWLNTSGGPTPFTERRRLALRNIERILARGIACGLDERLPAAEVDEIGLQLAALAAKPTAGAEHKVDGPAWRAVLKTHALLAKRRDAQPTLRHMASLAVNADLLLDLQCLAQSDDAYPALYDFATTVPEGEFTHDLRLFGWRCAIYGDQELTATARENLVRIGRDRHSTGTYYTEPFDRGYEAGQLELQGQFEWMRPASVQLAEQAPSEFEPNWTELPLDDEPGVLASWGFRGGGFVQGWARGGATQLVKPNDSGTALTFAVPGRSAVRLSMRVPEGFEIRDIREVHLVLQHSRTPRPYQPYRGHANFEVIVAGEFIESQSVRLDEPGEDVVVYPIEFLEAGDRDIVIRLGNATTEYQLARAWLVEPAARTLAGSAPTDGSQRVVDGVEVDPALETPGGPGDQVVGGQ